MIGLDLPSRRIYSTDIDNEVFVQPPPCQEDIEDYEQAYSHLNFIEKVRDPEYSKGHPVYIAVGALTTNLALFAETEDFATILEESDEVADFNWFNYDLELTLKAPIDLVRKSQQGEAIQGASYDLSSLYPAGRLDDAQVFVNFWNGSAKIGMTNSGDCECCRSFTGEQQIGIMAPHNTGPTSKVLFALAALAYNHDFIEG